MRSITFRMHAFDRINSLVDGDFVEIGETIVPGDPLEWVDKRPYTAKLEADREKSQTFGSRRRRLRNARRLSGRARRDGFQFSRRHDGHGRRRTDRALARAGTRPAPCPASSFTASGGARMEEGMLALMQMAKTSLAVERFHGRRQSLRSRYSPIPRPAAFRRRSPFRATSSSPKSRASIGFAGTSRHRTNAASETCPITFRRPSFCSKKARSISSCRDRTIRSTLVRDARLCGRSQTRRAHA